MKKPANQKTNKPNYEQLGRMLENIYESGYIDRNRMYKMSFLKGVVSGLGGVIGATLVVGLLLWILSLLNFTPLRPLTERIKDTVQTQK